MCGGAWRNSIYGTAVTGLCTTDANCPVDKVCIAFSCVKGPECRTDSECFPSEKCSGGSCVPGQQQPECESDWDCPGANQVCDSGKCRAVYGSHTQCTSNSDCGWGCFCRSNACWCYE